MSGDIKKLRRLADEENLEIIEYPDGRILVVGGMVAVHWWPNSKRQTAYAEGAPKGKRFATARNVVNLAINGTM